MIARTPGLGCQPSGITREVRGGRSCDTLGSESPVNEFSRSLFDHMSLESYGGEWKE